METATTFSWVNRMKRSCDRCRKRRVKCSKQSANSPCQGCCSRDLKCTYFDPPMRRGPRPKHINQQEVYEKVPTLHSNVDLTLLEKLETSTATSNKKVNVTEGCSSGSSPFNEPIYHLFNVNKSVIKSISYGTFQPKNWNRIMDRRILQFLVFINPITKLLNPVETENICNFIEAPSKIFLFNCIYVITEYFLANQLSTHSLQFLNSVNTFLNRCLNTPSYQPLQLKNMDIQSGLRIINFILTSRK